MFKTTLVGTILRKNYVAGNDGKRSYLVMSISSTRGKDENGNYRNEYVEARAFGPRADFINKFFDEGSPIVCEGRIQQNAREIRDRSGNPVVVDGKPLKIYSNNIYIDAVEFVPRGFGKKTETSTSDTDVDFSGFDPGYTEDEVEVDLPFA